MFNEYLFHLCDCTCSNVMCVCSTICESNQKDFCSFCFAIGSDLYHPCFSKFFNFFFVWKTCFLGVFVTYFMCMLSWVLNDPILKFFGFGQRVLRFSRDFFASKAYLQKISWVLSRVSFPRKFPNQLFKGHSVRHLF